MLAVGSCVVLMLLLMDLCFGVHFDLVAFDSVFLLFTCFTGSCNRLSGLRSGFCPFSRASSGVCRSVGLVFSRFSCHQKHNNEPCILDYAKLLELHHCLS